MNDITRVFTRHLCLSAVILAIGMCIADPVQAQDEPDQSEPADSLLLQLQREMEEMEEQAPSEPADQAAPRTGFSLNPALSAIGDFRSSYTDLGDRNVDLYIKGLEVLLNAAVDPYARADFQVAFGREAPGEEMEVELEIATLTSLSLPYQLQVTLGKFRPHASKVGLLHPHQLSTVNFPLMVENFFGGEGLIMEGAGISWLVPNPLGFFQEAVLEVGRPEENASLDPGETNRLLYIGHLKNFFDLTENATLELGLMGLSGPNPFGFMSTLAGVNLTYKWKPLQFNTYKSFTWQSEVTLNDARITEDAREQSVGLYSFLEYQVGRRSFIGGRFDYAEFPGDEPLRDVAGSLQFRFQPSEFQVLSLEVQHVDRNYDDSGTQVTLRMIFGIGAHAAHPY